MHVKQPGLAASFRVIENEVRCGEEQRSHRMLLLIEPIQHSYILNLKQTKYDIALSIQQKLQWKIA